MRKIFILFISCFCVLPLFGQDAAESLFYTGVSPTDEKQGSTLHLKMLRDLAEKQNTGGDLMTGSAKINLDYLIIEDASFTGGWENARKATFIYDVKGNIVQLHTYHFTASWWPYAETIYLYDTNRLLLLEAVTNIFHSGNQSWQKHSKDVYIYNTDKKLKEEINLSWYNSSWIMLNKSELQYDGNGNVSEITYYERSGLTMMPKTITEYTYGTTGEITAKNFFVWNGTSWEIKKYESSYDAQRRLVEEIQSNWNKSSWELTSKKVYSYDARGNNTAISNYNWHPNEKAWVIFEYTKEAINYDANTKFEDINFPKGIMEVTPEDKPLQISRYQENPHVFVYGRTTFHYSGIIGISNPSNPSPIKIYPNPAKDHLNIDISEMPEAQSIELMDMTGKIILQQELTSTVNQLKLDKLSTGMYLYRISGKEGISTGKFMVE